LRRDFFISLSDRATRDPHAHWSDVRALASLAALHTADRGGVAEAVADAADDDAAADDAFFRLVR